jgi:hypothetical protein
MEDDHNFLKMEDDINFFGKWKTTSIYLKMEYDLNFLKMEDNLNPHPPHPCFGTLVQHFKMLPFFQIRLQCSGKSGTNLCYLGVHSKFKKVKNPEKDKLGLSFARLMRS